MLTTSSRIFADHHQFYVYDSDYDHYNDPNLDWNTAERLDFGYLATNKAIYISTVASSNSHRLRVFIGEQPSFNYERVFQFTLLLNSGALAISAPANEPEDDLMVKLEPGAYRLSICSSAIGADELSLFPNRKEPMTDDEFLTHDDFEYYDLFVQSGV